MKQNKPAKILIDFDALNVDIKKVQNLDTKEQKQVKYTLINLLEGQFLLQIVLIMHSPQNFYSAKRLISANQRTWFSKYDDKKKNLN